MAQVKPEYEELEDFNQIAVQIVNKYPELFGGVDPEEYVDKIKCVAITNKERKEGKDLIEKITGIGYPVKLYCEISYLVVVYMNDWNQMDSKNKSALVLSALRRIPFDPDKEGSLNSLDLKDDSTLVRTLGVDYLLRDDIPDILSDDVDWLVCD